MTSPTACYVSTSWYPNSTSCYPPLTARRLHCSGESHDLRMSYLTRPFSRSCTPVKSLETVGDGQGRVQIFRLPKCASRRPLMK